MTGRLRDLTVNRDGTQNIVVTVPDDFTKQYDALKEHPVSIEIKKASKGRSLNANSFCWAMCNEIGKAMTPPLAKEDVYKKAIHAVGVYWETPVNKLKVDEVRRYWTAQGEGWVFDIIDEHSPSEMLCHLYFGSSTYTQDAMRTLLDWLVDQCEQMQIPVPLSKKQEQELIERWGMK